MLIKTKNTRDALKKLNDRKKQEINKIKRIKAIENVVEKLTKKGYKIKEVRVPK